MLNNKRLRSEYKEEHKRYAKTPPNWWVGLMLGALVAEFILIIQLCCITIIRIYGGAQ